MDFTELPPACGLSKSSHTLGPNTLLVQSANSIQGHKNMPDLQTWMQYSSVYASVLTLKHPQHIPELLVYSCDVMRKSRQYKWSSWVDIGWQDWSKVDPIHSLFHWLGAESLVVLYLCDFGSRHKRLPVRSFLIRHILNQVLLLGLPQSLTQPLSAPNTINITHFRFLQSNKKNTALSVTDTDFPRSARVLSEYGAEQEWCWKFMENVKDV